MTEPLPAVDFLADRYLALVAKHAEAEATIERVRAVLDGIELGVFGKSGGPGYIAGIVRARLVGAGSRGGPA